MLQNWRLGIDVGGTNTDAVVIDEHLNLVEECKYPTSKDVTSGISGALHTILEKIGDKRSRIGSATLGTTHCTNALIERKRLNYAAIIRIGAPATTAIPPLSNWPLEIQQSMKIDAYIVRGGYEFNGKEIVPLDEAHIREIAKELLTKNIEAVAISSVFSTVADGHEKRTAEILNEVFDHKVPLTLSSEVGYVGLLERENAAIINSLLKSVAKTTAESFHQALSNEGLNHCQVFICQNDGTVMTAEFSTKFPVLTIACGPTNSIRGGSFLTKEKDAIIIDIGGTTTDIGVLVHGFPRDSMVAVEIGGIRTNFRMPDVHSIGLGGGSIVRVNGDQITVGPDSVGYQVSEKALCFGGDVFTATDVAVGLGMVELGDKSKVNISIETLKKAQEIIVAKVEDCIDSMKTNSDDALVILVGGGSILMPGKLQGASQVLRPDHFGVANAIGSAISQVSGSSERVFQITPTCTRDDAMRESKDTAISEAIVAGADPKTIEILSVEEVPFAYLDGAVKIRVKAVGDLLIKDQ